MAITGDFNNWNTTQHISDKAEYGVHTIRIPFKKTETGFELPIPIDSTYKVYMETHQGEKLYKHPLHCEYAVHNH